MNQQPQPQLPLTLQQAFDIAATGLLKQGRRSMSTDDHCVYRSPDGCKCAIGFLIPDELYDESFDEHRLTVEQLNDRLTLLTESSGVRRSFLRQLQELHDLLDPSEWRDELRGLAARFGLSTGVLDNVG